MLTTGRQFRDWAAEANHPFTDESTRELGFPALGLFPNDVLLDALLDAPAGWKAPYHISMVGEWSFEVSDATGKGPLIAAPPYYRLMLDDMDHGVLVPGPGLSVFMDTVGNKRLTPEASSLVFLAGKSFTTNRAGNPYAKVYASDTYRTLNGALCLVASEGLEINNDGGKVNLVWSATAPSKKAIRYVGIKDSLGNVLFPPLDEVKALTIAGGTTKQTLYVNNTGQVVTIEGGGCPDA